METITRPKAYNGRDMLQQVRKFLKGVTHDSRSTQHELVKSGVMLLNTLPSTRFAVLEYFGSVYDNAVYNLLSTNEDSMDGELCDLIGEIQQSLLAFVQTNPHAWTPIISSWSIEQLGELSSKYTKRHLDKKRLSMSASLNEVLQMWMGCRASQSLIEISSECIAAMVGDTPDSCVDALLETSVKHSPHFDWVVAHIGSCFPTTIINRVLMCGLKDFCLHGNNQAEIGIVSQDNMPKFASVVGILGHLASQHGREIQLALLALFEESLVEESGDLHHHVVPFLLRLASLSPMLLKVITTDFISILNTEVLNKLAVQSQHWYEKGEADNDSLLHLLVHLMTISENGTYRMLQILLEMACPDVPTVTEDSMETDQSSAHSVRTEVQHTCKKVLELLLSDLSKVAHTRGVEGTEEVAFLKGLQHHATSISRLYSQAKEQRQKYLSQVLKCLTLSSGASQASRLMSDILINAHSHTQLSFFVRLQEELQIKYAEILENLLTDFFHLVLQESDNAEVKVQALGNLLTLLKWEEAGRESNTVSRHTFRIKLSKHLEELTSLLCSPNLKISVVVMDILNRLQLPTILGIPQVFKLCHAAVAHLFRVLDSRDLSIRQKFELCTACQQCLVTLCHYPTAQKTLLKLLLETIFTKEFSPCLGGKTIGGSSVLTLAPQLGSHQPVLLQANRLKSSSQGMLTQSKGRSQGDRIALLSKDQIYHNKQQFLEILWKVACHSHQGQAKQASSSTETEKVTSKDELTPHIARILAITVTELVTPDVMYNSIPWTDEDFLKVTIERDLLIKKKFEENPILWDVFDYLSSAPDAMCYSSAVLRGLLATQLYHWDSCRDQRATNSPKQFETTLKLIHYMRKGHFMPPPLSYTGEILQFLSPYEVFLVLINLWIYLKENPPVPEEKNWKEKGVEAKYLEPLRPLFHSNISKLGHLYGRFFGPL